MKTIFMAAFAGAMLLAGHATAADVGKVNDAGLLSSYDWSGVYIGWNGGISSSTLRPNLTILGEPESFGPQGVHGLVTGPAIGFNAEMANLLLGVEVDSMATNQSTTLGICPAQCSAASFSFEEKMPFLATARLRAGLAAGRFLFYGTAGGAVSEIKSSSKFQLAGLDAGQNFTDTEFGWAAGGGIEFAILDHLTAKIEYLHVDTGGASQLLSAAGFPHPPVGIDIKMTEDLVRTGIAFRFGGGAAVR